VTLDIDRKAEKEKRDAALSSVTAAVFLTGLKLAVGILTGSLGILAEAMHSGLDLVAALVTFFAVRISDRPPDKEHQYGHGKVENLSALIETLLLLITCIWIIYEAIERLFFKSVEIDASIWAFLVMAISIVVDVTRSRILYAAARKHNSQALEADALHFSTDIWSSAVVIVGLGLVWLGERLLGPEWAWLAKADAVAALVVAGIVIYVSLQLGRRAVSVLLDAAPPGLAGEIAAEAVQVQGVQSLGPVRVRQAGAFTFVDLTVDVDRSASLEGAHEVAEAVDRRVSKLIGMGDVVVHVDPVRRSGENLSQAVSAVSARLGLRTHEVHAHEIGGDYFVDLHVEVPPDLTLREAHDRVCQLEDAVRAELPQVSEVHSHIEPILPAVTPVGQPVSIDATDEAELRARIEQIVGGVPGLREVHSIQIRPAADGLDVVLHCYADPDMPVAQAHRLAEAAEKAVHAQVEGLSQVLIHVEPEE
jgi:cation diffusion facilitator family transporter